MLRYAARALSHVVERMARVSPPKHRDLIRGMVAELASIEDPAEHTRFAFGAIAAITRLSLVHLGREILVLVASDGHLRHTGGLFMPTITTRQLLGRHLVPFSVSLIGLTGLLVANWARQWVPRLAEGGQSTGTIAEAVLLAVPFSLALTIPMAVFLAVAWVFSGLAKEGLLKTARGDRHGMRRLLVPVLAVATAVSALSVVGNTQLLPRSNARLAEVLTGTPATSSARTMTVGELRGAAADLRESNLPQASLRAVAYEVEIHKKLALAAACIFLALTAASLTVRFPTGGRKLILMIAGSVFVLYYFLLLAGESLADQQLVSPLVAMWSANALLLAMSLLLTRGRGARTDPIHG